MGVSQTTMRRRACRTRHPSPENTDGKRWPLCYLPTLLLRGAHSSRVEWRPGKSTAGRRGRSASSLHCRGEGDEFKGLKQLFQLTNTHMQPICFSVMQNQYPLEQLGVEKRSMAGAVLMVPPLVEIGDVSVVEKEGLLESSLSLFS